MLDEYFLLEMVEELLILKMCSCMTYHGSILLVQQLVPCCQGIPVLLFDEVFYFLVGEVNSIVEVSAPENIVVGVQQTTLAGANMYSYPTTCKVLQDQRDSL